MTKIRSESYVLNRYSRIPVAQPQDMNNVFRLVNPVCDMDTYIFKASVFTKHDKYE